LKAPVSSIQTRIQNRPILLDPFKRANSRQPKKTNEERFLSIKKDQASLEEVSASKSVTPLPLVKESIVESAAISKDEDD